MQNTHQKPLIMSPNGIHPSSVKQFDWHALLLALAVSISTGSFVFAFKMNAAVAVIQDQKVREEQDRLEMKQTMNQIQLDVRDLRDKVIRAEK